MKLYIQKKRDNVEYLKVPNPFLIVYMLNEKRKETKNNKKFIKKLLKKNFLSSCHSSLFKTIFDLLNITFYAIYYSKIL